LPISIGAASHSAFRSPRPLALLKVAFGGWPGMPNLLML